ncbi:MAG: PIN domain-containing protein [Opitutaceae bacterium]
MTYLLDVNALIALGISHHADHARAARWVRGLQGDQLASCSITEIGFVRITCGGAGLVRDIAVARQLLHRLKAAADITLLTDVNSAADLPTWVLRPAQVTDGHLLALAAKHGAKLATLDTGIRGAFLIP